MAARRACRLRLGRLALAGSVHGDARRFFGPCVPIRSQMWCYCMLRRMIKLQFFLNRALACDERICCFGLAPPLRTRWRQPTRAASTNPVRPPMDDM
eukprot:6212134-Pleurochrysis_carterae.AAC.1